MRICIHKPTGRVIEMQSDATPGTLIANNSPYYIAGELEEREVTREEYDVMMGTADERFKV